MCAFSSARQPVGRVELRGVGGSVVAGKSGEPGASGRGDHAAARDLSDAMICRVGNVKIALRIQRHTGDRKDAIAALLKGVQIAAHEVSSPPRRLKHRTSTVHAASISRAVKIALAIHGQGALRPTHA